MRSYGNGAAGAPHAAVLQGYRRRPGQHCQFGAAEGPWSKQGSRVDWADSQSFGGNLQARF